MVSSKMGCSPSAASGVDVVGTDLRLPNSKLKFNVNQLKALNKRLTSLKEDLKTPFLSDDAESVAERLIQGLISGAAAKDSRFKTKFIVILHKSRICKSGSLEYLVLLDVLEDNCAFAEGPPGCARLRPQDKIYEEWQDFLSPSGYLRRDKVVERWVEVLAAAAADGVNGENYNSEASFSMAPGHLVPPIVLQRLRNLKPQEQCFYGNVKEGNQFPSSRDYRIAIVESSPWVRVRLAGGVLGSGAEAKLALGIAYHGWPSGTDFPARAPLGHPDALLFYKAAQTGFFVVGGGPAAGIQWSERSAGWQIWMAGARSIVGARGEGISRVASVCAAVLDHLRATGQPPLRAISRFMIEEAILWRAEKLTGRNPAGDVRSWIGSHLAHHVLCIIDLLLGQIRVRTGRHYFFQGCDMIKMAVWRGARIGERDWRGDADCLDNFLNRLYEESINKPDDGIEIFPSNHERLETALCCRWGLLLQELTPAGSTRSRRLAGAPPYSPRQLAYVSIVSRELLAARQLVIQESNEWYQGVLSSSVQAHLDPIEDLIHLLAIILDQARDYFIKTNFNDSIFTKTITKDSKSTSSQIKNNNSKDTVKKQKLKNCFDQSAACLLDSVRRDHETQKEELINDAVLVRTLLKWLYKAVDDDKKYLGPVLKPYLDLLFSTSHENCWHLEEFKFRMSNKEMESLAKFCNMVGENKISPADGILDYASEGWLWAESVLDTLDKVCDTESALRIIFTSDNGELMKFDLSLPHNAEERENWNMFHISRHEGQIAKLKLAEKCVIEAFSYGLDPENSNFDISVRSSKSEELLNRDLCSVSNTNTLRSINNRLGSEQNLDSSSKYHTLRSLDLKYNTLRNSESLFGSCWSSRNTVNMRGKLQRPTLLGKLNSPELDQYFEMNDDIEYSLHCNLRDSSPITLILTRTSQLAPHREYTGIVKALISMQRYSVLQELAGWLGTGGEKGGALKALHRLARGGRRASGPNIPSNLQPSSIHRHNYTISPRKTQNKHRASIRQYYRKKNIDALSDNESSKKSEKKSTTSESTSDYQIQTPSPVQNAHLDIDIQQEYLENKSLYDKCQVSTMNDHYMELCKEAIAESNTKLSKSPFNFGTDTKNKIKSQKKINAQSSSVGRAAGKDTASCLANIQTKNSLTFDKNMKKDYISVNSLLGTCREARLHHTARKSVIPKTNTATDYLFGDSFKISPIYSGVQSEYHLVTQSILQNSGPQVLDRQRYLTSKDKK